MSWPFLALSVVILLTLQNGNDINVTSDTGPAIGSALRSEVLLFRGRQRSQIEFRR